MKSSLSTLAIGLLLTTSIHSQQLSPISDSAIFDSSYYIKQIAALKEQIADLNKPSSNKHYWLKQALIVTTSMYAGWCEGENEILTHDYWNYLEKWPNTNQQYTNPKLSTKNKYKDRDPNKGPAFFLSTTLLVGVTDLYHRNKTARNVGMATALTFSLTLRKNMKFKHALIQSVIMSGSFILGKGIAHQFYTR